jgi:hypothetical protein
MAHHVDEASFSNGFQLARAQVVVDYKRYPTGCIPDGNGAASAKSLDRVLNFQRVSLAHALIVFCFPEGQRKDPEIDQILAVDTGKAFSNNVL